MWQKPIKTYKMKVSGTSPMNEWEQKSVCVCETSSYILHHRSQFPLFSTISSIFLKKKGIPLFFLVGIFTRFCRDITGNAVKWQESLTKSTIFTVQYKIY